MNSLKQIIAAAATATALSGAAVYAQDTKPVTPAFTPEEQGLFNVVREFQACSDDMYDNHADALAESVDKKWLDQHGRAMTEEELFFETFSLEDSIVRKTCLEKLGTDENTLDQQIEDMVNKYGEKRVWRELMLSL